jgi:hypothetical protein
MEKLHRKVPPEKQEEFNRDNAEAQVNQKLYIIY